MIKSNSPKVEIRKARSSDLKAILALNQQMVDLHHALDPYYDASRNSAKRLGHRLKEFLQEPETLIVIAENQKGIVGFLIGNIDNPALLMKPKQIGKILEIFVSDDFRKTGVGEKLVKYFMEWLPKSQICNIELSVDSRNLGGIAFWKKLGFQEFNKRMRKDF